MNNNKKSTNLGFGGGVIGVIGGVLCYVGRHMNYDIERQLSSVFNSGSRDETGDILFFIGVALIIIGIIMIAVNIFQYYQPNQVSTGSASEKSKEEKNKDEVWNGWICKKCGRRNYNYVGTCGCGVTKEENTKLEKSSVETKKIVSCPICATKVEFGIFTCCPNCNQRIDWSKISEEESKENKEKVISTQHNTNEETNVRFCTNCGAKLVDGNNFCGSCGVKINKEG